MINNENAVLTVLETEVQDQGAGKFGARWGRTFWFTDSYLFSVSSHGPRDESSLGLPFTGPSPMPEGCTFMT